MKSNISGANILLCRSCQAKDCYPCDISNIVCPECNSKVKKFSKGIKCINTYMYDAAMAYLQKKQHDMRNLRASQAQNQERFYAQRNEQLLNEAEKRRFDRKKFDKCSFVVFSKKIIKSGVN